MIFFFLLQALFSAASVVITPADGACEYASGLTCVIGYTNMGETVAEKKRAALAGVPVPVGLRTL